MNEAIELRSFFAMKTDSFFIRECGNPKLLKFGGKAKEFSPRARIRHWLGWVTGIFDNWCTVTRDKAHIRPESLSNVFSNGRKNSDCFMIFILFHIKVSVRLRTCDHSLVFGRESRSEQSSIGQMTKLLDLMFVAVTSYRLTVMTGSSTAAARKCAISSTTTTAARWIRRRVASRCSTSGPPTIPYQPSGTAWRSRGGDGLWRATVDDGRRASSDELRWIVRL